MTDSLCERSPMRPCHILLFASRERTVEGELFDDRLAACLGAAGLRVIRMPHLYDLVPDSAITNRLRGLDGDLVVLARLYPRAAFWTLAAHGLTGRMGVTSDSPAEESGSRPGEAPASTPRRTFWCFDLRQARQFEALVAEIQQLVGDRVAASPPERWEEPLRPRWYPVIDYGRCLGCLECLNFCLFGVYELGDDQTIRALQPDACRDGCPACSRVCPGGAILFPAHGDVTIAGVGRRAAGPAAGLGAAPSDKDLERARAEQSQALGAAEDRGPKKAENPAADELDRLVDGLDG